MIMDTSCAMWCKRSPNEDLSTPFQDMEQLRTHFRWLNINKDWEICSSHFMMVLGEFHGEKRRYPGTARNCSLSRDATESDFIICHNFTNHLSEGDKHIVIV